MSFNLPHADVHSQVGQEQSLLSGFENCFGLFGAPVPPLSDSMDSSLHLSLEFVTSGILSFSLQMSEETEGPMGDGVSAASCGGLAAISGTLWEDGTSVLRAALVSTSGSGRQGVPSPVCYGASKWRGAEPRCWCLRDAYLRGELYW